MAVVEGHPRSLPISFADNPVSLLSDSQPDALPVSEVYTGHKPTKRNPLVSTQMIDGLVQRDEETWNTFVKQSTSLLQALARTTGVSTEVAQEVAQDALLSIYKHIDVIDTNQNLDGYIIRTVKNAAIDKLRGKEGKAARNIHISALAPDDAGLQTHKEEIIFVSTDPSVEEQVELLDQRQTIHRALQYGSARDRMIFTMRSEGYSLREIAGAIGNGISEDAIIKLSSRLMNRLKLAVADPQQAEAIMQRGRPKKDMSERPDIPLDEPTLLAHANDVLGQRQFQVFSSRQRGISTKDIALELSLSVGAINKDSLNIRHALESDVLRVHGYKRLADQAEALQIPHYIYGKAIQAGKLKTLAVMGMHYVTDTQMQQFLKSREPTPPEKETIQIHTTPEGMLTLSPQTIQHMADKLTPHQRRVFLLRQQGMSLDKVAKAVGIRYTQAKSAAKNAFETIDSLFTEPNGYERLTAVARRYDLKPTTFFTAAKNGRLGTFQVMGTLYSHDDLVREFVDKQKEKEKKQDPSEHIIFQRNTHAA